MLAQEFGCEEHQDTCIIIMTQVNIGCYKSLLRDIPVTTSQVAVEPRGLKTRTMWILVH